MVLAPGSAAEATVQNYLRKGKREDEMVVLLSYLTRCCFQHFKKLRGGRAVGCGVWRWVPALDRNGVQEGADARCSQAAWNCMGRGLGACHACSHVARWLGGLRGVDVIWRSRAPIRMRAPAFSPVSNLVALPGALSPVCRHQPTGHLNQATGDPAGPH